jgi:hypothetical protein
VAAVELSAAGRSIIAVNGIEDSIHLISGRRYVRTHVLDRCNPKLAAVEPGAAGMAP